MMANEVNADADPDPENDENNAAAAGDAAPQQQQPRPQDAAPGAALGFQPYIRPPHFTARVR